MNNNKLFDIGLTLNQVQEAFRNALNPDRELNKEGVPADAKAVGDTLAKQSEAITSKANGIIDTATGEVIALTDSAEAPLSGLVVYGKSTQDGTPTPDAPVPIVSVGEDGVMDISVYGANLFDKDKLTKGWLLEEGSLGNGEDGFFVSDFIPVLPNTVYYVGARGSSRTKFYTINKTAVTNSWDTGSDAQVFTTPTDARFVRITVTSGFIDNLMLNVGETALPYEPYKPAQTLPVSTPYGLCGIPVTSGGNYTDASGQQWVCDEIDFVRGVRVQRVGEGYITNNSNIGIDNTEKYPGRRYVRLSTPSIAIASAIMSDSLTYNHYNSSLIGLAVENAGISLSATKNDVLYFNIAYMQSEDTVEATKEVLAQYTLKYVYALKTPIETPLTEEELAAYRALQTNYPNTTIYADDNAGLSVGYSADTKLYIDKKFAELAAAIVNN